MEKSNQNMECNWGLLKVREGKGNIGGSQKAESVLQAIPGRVVGNLHTNTILNHIFSIVQNFP
jgi:hypothetical protein